MRVNRTYILEIEIDTGNDEFWEEIGNRSGRKEVKEEVKNCLAEHGFFAPQCRVKVIEVLTPAAPHPEAIIMTDLAAKIAELEAGCEGVTPGPWKHPYGDWRVRRYIPISTIAAMPILADCKSDASGNEQIATAAHIARCDPHTILALIAAWRAEKARADELEMQIGFEREAIFDNE